MHQLHLAEIVLGWSRSFWTLEKSTTIRGAYFSLLNVTKSGFSNKVQKCINNLIWLKEVKIQFYKYLMNELDFYTVVMLLRYALSIIVLHIIKISRCCLCQRDRYCWVGVMGLIGCVSLSLTPLHCRPFFNNNNNNRDLCCHRDVILFCCTASSNHREASDTRSQPLEVTLARVYI